MGGNLGDLFEAAATATPGATALVVDGERWTFAQLDDRVNRLAEVLALQGIAREDRVGILLGNTNEHLEVLLACFKLRALAVNLNTRLVAGELAELLSLSQADVVVHEPDLGDLLPSHVTGISRGPGYEAALAAADPTPPDPAGGRSGDDLYVLYTGGTTGRPKGVLWRHDDLRVAALAGDLGLGARRVLVACPLFHGTGQWMALAAVLAGGTVLTTRARSVEPERVWGLAEAERATHLVLVGDAYARPLVEALELRPGRWRLDDLTVVLSGGAQLSPDVTSRLLAALPCAMVVDGYGATETGGHARLVSVAGSPTTTTSAFRVGDDTAVLDDQLRPIPRGEPTEGWLARRGPLPLGYDGDPEATAQTFPVVDGVRWSVPGDRARWLDAHRVEILGRGALTINTGGEKVHAEEVEGVLRDHPAVADAIVVGAPDERWGELITAVVTAVPGATVTLDDLVEHCRGVLAPFKAPRRLVLVDEVRRSASGKPDYRWARGLAE
ncbi:MAG: AMP-binding protein [Actinomycetia bacterium]|nr:AMP-binding protein [Actinomycetes bacterium]